MQESNAATDCLIRPLSPELLPDYLHFFDHEAFRDNPRWASCYCHFSYAQHQEMKWQERTAEENRAAVSKLACGGQMEGYLAYVDEKVVAWCNAAPRERFTTLPADTSAEAGRTGAIVCFVVAKPYRGRGIARRLLTAACDGFRERGFEQVEAYPRREAPNEASNYHGPLSMYVKAGFEPVSEKDSVVTVCKKL